MQHSFEKAAMVTLLESALAKAEDKIGRRKRGGKELKAFATIVQRAVSKDMPFDASVKAGLKVAMAQSTDSLSWMLQGIAGDLFWTYRRMATGIRRAESQARGLIEDNKAGESSVAELLAELAEDGDIDLDLVADDTGDTVDDITIDEVEDALMQLHSAMDDVFIQCSDSRYDRLPFTSRGQQIATSLSSALALADMIIADGNAERRVADRSILG